MTNAYPRPDSARTPQDEGSTPPSVLFQTGFVRDVDAHVDRALRALRANRLEDAYLGLERLSAQLKAQAQWEQQ